MTKKTAATKTSKQASGKAHAAVDVLQHRRFTVAGENIDLKPYEELTRQVRRALRNALMKAAPESDSATGKADLFLAAYDAGVILLNACGASIDPNDDSLPVDDADELDQTIMLAGMQVLGEMTGGSPKKAGEAAETTD